MTVYNRAMAKRKRKTGMDDATAVVMGFANLVDALFLRYTGKTMQTLLTESAQRTRELPTGERTAPVQPEPEMQLADAYMVLGLKPDASMDNVKRNYRNLARAFHSDKGSVMNDEAMKLLNRAYERITKGRE
jgi:DnaJ-domain-containing protein 1